MFIYSVFLTIYKLLSNKHKKGVSWALLHFSFFEKYSVFPSGKDWPLLYAIFKILFFLSSPIISEMRIKISKRIL